MEEQDQGDFKVYGKDVIVVTDFYLPAFIKREMVQEWSPCSARVFETIAMLTNNGEYGVLIKGEELAEESSVGYSTLFQNLKFLIRKKYLLRRRHESAGRPSIFYVNKLKLMFDEPVDFGSEYADYRN